ncbi:MAG: hypothetical protein M3Z31_11250 [Pseudomonadota bacterium]|nr:hypothetical protein [Pseudomonadota bacterium]
MALLGNAAMLLWYDIVPERVEEHDDWHTRQHFPERLAIPGFVRAQRWVSSSSSPRYLVVYEVADIDVLSSAPYLKRLNEPTVWTSSMMPSFRGMVRGFCQLLSCHGSVLGAYCVSVRFDAAPGMGDRLHQWLERELLPKVMRSRGFASAFVLRSGRTPEMTAEQLIRGRDAGVDLVLLVTAYGSEPLAALMENELHSTSLAAQGAASRATTDAFQLACISHAFSDEPRMAPLA